MLTAEQKTFYSANGYLIFENVLSADELKDLRAGSEHLQEERRKLGGESKLAVIHNVPLMHEAFMRAARHPFMLDVVSDLIGENLKLQHAKLNWKAPPTTAADVPTYGTSARALGGGGEVGWHQDFPFFPHTNMDLLACMFVVDDATPENGCMRVIPGSHKRGPVDHYTPDGKFAGRCSNPADYERDEREGNVVDFVVPAGSMTVHHCCTLHASYPNRSTNPRRGLAYQISAGDSIQLGGNLHKVWGTWLKGTDPLQARLLDGTTYRLTAPLTNKGDLEPTGDWRRETQD